MRKLIVLVAALLAALSFAAAAAATTSPPPTPKPIPKTLHLGMWGKRVCALGWLLSGHDPSHYRSIKTYHGPIGHRSCKFTKQVKVATWNMKYRLGYPVKALRHGRGYLAGVELFNILQGREARPLVWIALAAKRQAAIRHAIYVRSRCENRIVAIASSQIGVHEWPDGSNRGPGISYSSARTSPSYQSVTGAYGAAWCASFAQWVLYKVGKGPIADRTAGVFYMRDWLYRRGLLHSTPKPGELVLFLWSQGHMGIVTKVTQDGFYTVEGNTSNGVYQRFYRFTRVAIAFGSVPGCS